MKTDITVLLDRSGSMESIKADTIGGFNQFLAAQKAAGASILSLVQFDTGGYDRVIDAKPIAQAEPLSDQTFQPRGGTPLLDAMARVIAETGNRFKAMVESERPEKVILVIITDGEENSSHEHTREQVMQQVAHQRDVYKWEFIYLGANQDAIKAAANVGISAQFTATYTGANTQRAYGAVNRVVYAMSSGAAVEDCAFTDDERSELITPKPAQS